MNKKGVIELSMTTIIVIVIGVTLLILGLTLVRILFEEVPAREEICSIFLDGKEFFEGNLEAEECKELARVCETFSGCTYLKNAEVETCFCEMGELNNG